MKVIEIGLLLAIVLSVGTALWGTYVIDVADFTIHDVELYKKFGHWKNGSEAGEPSNDKVDVDTTSLVSLYEVQFRAPFVDIVRFSNNLVNNENFTDSDASKYRKLRHMVPRTTITYDITKSERTKEECYDVCHGDFDMTDSNAFSGSGSVSEMACYLLLPGCALHAGNIDDANKIEVLNLTLGDECVEDLEAFSGIKRKDKPMTARHFYFWAILVLWMLQALLTFFVFIVGGTVEYPSCKKETTEKQKNTSLFWMLLILLFLAVAITVLMALHANSMENATGIKKSTDVGNSEFKKDECYAEYYTNVFGYINNDYFKSSTSNFTWAPEFHDPDKNIEPKMLYKNAFRRGPRNYYMITGSVIAGIHIIVYGLALIFGSEQKYAIGAGDSSAMSHLSSTLF